MVREQSPLERLLDIGVFAPLGLLLERDNTIKQLAKAGRKQVQFSRSLGRAALQAMARDTGETSTTASARPVANPSVSPVDGYGDLTAKQVIALVRTCTDAQAAWIRQTEATGRNRVTIMRALDARG